MAKHDGKKRTLIGDAGTVEKLDLMSVITIAVSNLMVLFLIIVGILAYVY